MFERFYGTAWHHPGIAFVAALAFAVALAWRRRFLVGWAILFTVEILADALATGGLSPVPPGSGLMTGLGIAFVILGDFRYFLLVEHGIAAKPGEAFTTVGSAPSGVDPAVVTAFIVPLTSTAIRELFPATFAHDVRYTFLVYEALFVALALAYRFVVVPRRAPPETRAWLLRLTDFELVQYGLWVFADLVIIFTKADVGFLLRLAPNTLYYALFLPFVWWTAPRGAREP